MNIDSLKAGFKAYLEEKGKLTEENEAQYNENTSIFSYANEFKAYINKNVIHQVLIFNLKAFQNF